jgi:hypothetical protein
VVRGEMEAKGMRAARVAEQKSYRGSSLNRRGFGAILDGAPSDIEYNVLCRHMHRLFQEWFGAVSHPLLAKSGTRLQHGGFRVFFRTQFCLEAFMQKDRTEALAECLSEDGCGVDLEWTVRDNPGEKLETERSTPPVKRRLFKAAPSTPSAAHAVSYAGVVAENQWERKYWELKQSSEREIQGLQDANAQLRGLVERAALVQAPVERVVPVAHNDIGVIKEVADLKERLDKMAERLIVDAAAWREEIQASVHTRSEIEIVRQQLGDMQQAAGEQKEAVRVIKEGFIGVGRTVQDTLKEPLQRLEMLESQASLLEEEQIPEEVFYSEKNKLARLWAVVRTMGGVDLENVGWDHNMSDRDRETWSAVQQQDNERKLRQLAEESNNQHSVFEAVAPRASGSAVGGRGTQNQPAPAGLAYPRSGAQATQSPAPEQGGWEVKESKSKKKKKKQKKSRERIAEEEAKVADKENTSHQGNAYGALSPEYREQEDAHSMSSVTSEDQEEKGGREKGRGTQFQSALADLAYHPSTPPQFLVGAGAASSDVTRDPGDDRKRGARFKGSYKL